MADCYFCRGEIDPNQKRRNAHNVHDACNELADRRERRGKCTACGGNDAQELFDMCPHCVGVMNGGSWPFLGYPPGWA